MVDALDEETEMFAGTQASKHFKYGEILYVFPEPQETTPRRVPGK